MSVRPLPSTTPIRARTLEGTVLLPPKGRRIQEVPFSSSWDTTTAEQTQVLENQVMVYKFPGSPAPPLGFIYWNVVMVEGIWCTI